jgi:hypothetical protein
MPGSPISARAFGRGPRGPPAMGQVIGPQRRLRGPGAVLRMGVTLLTTEERIATLTAV